MIKRSLWVAAALAPLTFAAASHAVAQTSIGSATTTPVSTSSTGDLTVVSGGSIAVGTSPALTAVTVNSANSVTNAGTISSTEATNYTDTNADGIADSNNGVAGQYAVDGSRFGIQTTSAGATGINNTGTITVVGENSAGIDVGPGGLAGDLFNPGTINVTGGNAGTNHISYGIHTRGIVNGQVSITGPVSATGTNAIAVALDQKVTGAVTISSSLTATGYRATTSPTYTGYLGIIENGSVVSNGELQQGGPGLSLGGDVGGGVNITGANTTTGVTAGSIISYGSAPAILIGGPSALTISPVATTTLSGAGGRYGLVVDGSVVGAGVYQGFNSTAIQIGGSNPLPVADNGVTAAPTAPLEGAATGNGGAFGAVTIAGGVDITGSVLATAQTADQLIGGVLTPGANTAIGLHIGSGATTPSITVERITTGSGTSAVTSAGSLSVVLSSNSASTLGLAQNTGPAATALQIDAGANVTTLTNSGTISALINGLTTTTQNGVATVLGGNYGTATAVKDLSGTLTTINNTGVISASFTTADGSIVGKPNAVTTALDLSANNATINQNANSDTTITPAIIGDIHFATAGSGGLILNAGYALGDVSYGTGAANVLTINGGTTLTGAVTEVSGGQLALSVNDGSLFDRSTSVLGASSLTIGAKGLLVLNADPANNLVGRIVVSGPATLANGANIGLNFVSKLTSTSPITYNLIDATTLSVSLGNIDTNLSGLFPYLYSASLSTPAAGQLDVTVARKTAAQLGLNAGEAGAYNAIYNAFSVDPAVNTAVLDKTDRKDFLKLYDQFLPDYAGGPFESLANGQQVLQRTQADAPLKLQGDESRGWVEEISIVNHHDDSEGGGYDASGFGMVAGLETAHGSGATGLTAAFLTTTVQDAAQTNAGSLTGSAVEVGAYWRASAGDLNLSASANGGYAFFNSRRLVYDVSQTPVLYREADSKWNGGLFSAGIRANYQLNAGRFYARPELAADYVVLYESAHTEHGGGTGATDAVDLAIASRTSQQASAQADVVFGANFGRTVVWRPELTVGWRGVVSGGPADTTAHFVSAGSAGNFTLSPNFQDKGGLLARLGFRAGGNYADFSADAGGEFNHGYQTYDARAVARFLF